MSGTWDASIMLIYIADDERLFPIDIIQNGDAFGVVANIRIGRNLMQFVDSCELFVSVRNLSQSNMLLSRHQSYALAPREAPLNQELQVKLIWNANEGDVLGGVDRVRLLVHWLTMLEGWDASMVQDHMVKVTVSPDSVLTTTPDRAG